MAVLELSVRYVSDREPSFESDSEPSQVEVVTPPAFRPFPVPQVASAPRMICRTCQHWDTPFHAENDTVFAKCNATPRITVGIGRASAYVGAGTVLNTRSDHFCSMWQLR